MAYREDEEKRIYELETAESLSAGTFVPVDKEGNELAEKFDLGQLKADLETAINKNSGQLISLQYTDMEGWTLPDGITWRDVAERATCSTVNNSMVCQSAGFIQYPGSERFFQINYRGAVYSDYRSEYEDFLSVYLDPETYEVLNTVKGKRSDVVGILHDNDGSYSIEVLKNGEYVTGTDAYNWLNNYNIFSIITQTDRLFYPTGSTAYNQPLVYTSPIFSDGSYIIVKVKSDGSVEYEYKSKKVDAPSTAPAAGQVLTFDGTKNVWSNPQEGVYILNYSEVTDIRDVDIEKAKSLPTFLKIDTENPLTISVPQYSGNPYTVNLQPGTLMRLEEVGATATSGTYTGPKFLIFGSKFGEEVGGSIMQIADLRVICCISLSAFGGVSKSLAVNGNTGGQLFGPEHPQPFPITTSFFIGKGPGNPNTNRTQNALGVQFQSFGQIRRQVLMPAEIQDHDFSTDTTPEQIQFMGWGATSNRAGYRTISEVPASTAQDEGKVLTVDSNGDAGWTAPTVRVFTGEYNPDADPADYSGLPDQADVLAAIDAGKDVVLMLKPASSAPYFAYRLYQKFQYSNRFLRADLLQRQGNIMYRDYVMMSYAGPDNPWTWSGGKSDVSYTAEFTYWAASKPLLSDMRAEREAGKAVFLVCGEDVHVGNYWLEKGTVLPLTLDTQRPGYATMSLEFACTGVFKGQDCVTVRCVVNGDNTWEWHAYIHPKSSAIAPEYDSTATYAVGDAVMHNGLRYECNTAISTAEAWDSTHWTETSIENVIGNVETLLAAL